MVDAGSIYIIDDDTALRTSLAELLNVRTGFEVMDFAEGKSWLDQEQSLRPGCVLLDYSMPAMSGLAVLEEMRRRASAHQVVIITGEGSISVAVQAMHAGANDFLEKPVSFEILKQAIDQSFQRLFDSMDVQRAKIDAQAKIDRLKPRELEVMLELADGHSNKVIAHRLGLSVRTVEVYRANLMDKLEVRSLAEIIKLAFNSGLISV